MTCFVSLRTQYANLGDEVINTLMLRELCARDDVTVLGQGVPDWYIDNVRASLGPLAERMRVVSSERSFFLSALRAGLLGDRSFLFMSCGEVSGTRSDYRRAGSLAALQYLPRLRLAMVGASCSSLSRSRAQLLRIATARATSLAVRDTRSQRLCAEHSIPLQLVPDLAFLLPMIEADRNTMAKPLAVFQLREIEQIPFETTVEIVNSLARRASDAGLAPCITWQVGHDADISQRLAAATKLPIEMPANIERDRLASFNALYDRAAVIFSNRLHGLLVAAARGAVAVPLLHGEERKVRGVFEDAGLADLILSSDIASDADIALTEEWRASNRERMKRVFDDASGRLRRFFDEIVGKAQEIPGSLSNG